MIKYSLEFTLHTYNFTARDLKTALTEFAQDLRVNEGGSTDQKGGDFVISLLAEDPTLIFDICSQFGRIKAVKVDEVKV